MVLYCCNKSVGMSLFFWFFSLGALLFAHVGKKVGELAVVHLADLLVQRSGAFQPVKVHVDVLMLQGRIMVLRHCKRDLLERLVVQQLLQRCQVQRLAAVSTLKDRL